MNDFCTFSKSGSHIERHLAISYNKSQESSEEAPVCSNSPPKRSRMPYGCFCTIYLGLACKGWLMVGFLGRWGCGFVAKGLQYKA